MVVRQDRTRWSEHEELKRPVSSVTHRLAQTVVIQRLSDANEAIMAALTELVIAKELRISNVRYNTPKPYFLVILVLPHDFNRRAISAQLELQMLAEEATKVYINIDITRYIRDVVVGIRNHPNIQGGLTARASQDLVTVTK
ncbi:uncharacterized protein BYT42DRAFT_497219 [Radiomyces spectabilis]|uniref:uncharacterized protein n=1 Tax=Radiomyces spectabilis TaxID=64574 RepID=UPI00221F332A|nr:uncharacterized protein BYT42DRAFT_497219 [Radiomyces spectabilis]KAI8377649.1 hypothetical protein BYT42DRAFT_497219 [Radiomyces spectabilis]